MVEYGGKLADFNQGSGPGFRFLDVLIPERWRPGFDLTGEGMAFSNRTTWMQAQDGFGEALLGFGNRSSWIAGNFKKKFQYRHPMLLYNGL